MLFFLALMLSYFGFTSLALAMNRHHSQLITGGKLSVRQKRLFTLLGWSALLLSIIPCVAQFGWGVGLTLWCGCLTLAATLLIAALTYQPRFGFLSAALGGVITLLFPFFILLSK